MITFITVYAACIAGYGLIGVAIGWLPAMVAAYIAFGLVMTLWAPILIGLTALVIWATHGGLG